MYMAPAAGPEKQRYMNLADEPGTDCGGDGNGTSVEAVYATPADDSIIINSVYPNIDATQVTVRKRCKLLVFFIKKGFFHLYRGNPHRL